MARKRIYELAEDTTPAADDWLVTDNAALGEATKVNVNRLLVAAGLAGGQTLVGGSAVTDKLTLQGTSGNGTATAAALQVNVGNAGATGAITVLNNGKVGILDAAPGYQLDVTGDINATGVLRIADVAVVGPQGALIADAKVNYGAGDLDSEAEVIAAINATNTTLNAILARLRAHGLIAT